MMQFGVLLAVFLVAEHDSSYRVCLEEVGECCLGGHPSKHAMCLIFPELHVWWCVLIRLEAGRIMQ
jgi:hypothetical protein